MRCGGQQVVERGRQHPRVDPAVSRLVRQRHVVPPAFGRDPLGDLRACAARAPRRRRRARPARSRADVADTPRCTGRCAPSAAGSSSTCTTVASGPMSSPCRMVHIVSDAPQPMMRSAAGDQLGGAAAWRTRRRCPAPTGPRRTGRSPPPRWRAARRSARRAPRSAGPACRAPRPATNTGRCGAVEQRGERRHRRRIRPRRAPRCDGGHAGRAASDGRLDVERQVEHHRAPLPDAGAVGAHDVVDGRRGRVHPLRHRADRAHRGVLVDAEVGPHRRSRGVRGQRQQRRAALRRLGDPGERVGEAAALMQGEHRHRSGRAGVRVGHHRRPGLVARRDERHPAAAERVGHVEVAAAHHPERVPDAEPGQHLADDVGNRGHGGEHARRYRGATGDRETASVIVIDGCHVATVDAADTEYATGHLSLDGARIRGRARARPRTSPAPSGSTAPVCWSHRASSTPTTTSTSGSPAATPPTTPSSAG